MRLASALSAVWLALCGATAASCGKKVVQPFPKEFVGVGVELTIRDQTPTVVRALRGGPAEQAGIGVNDRLIAIGDEPTEGLPLSEVVVRLRGKEGSQVVLTVQRGSEQLTTVVARHAMSRTEADYAARTDK